MIGAMAKAYTMTFDEVLDMSFQNLTLYGAVLPSSRNDRKGNDKGESYDMDDPANHHILRDLIDNSQ